MYTVGVRDHFMVAHSLRGDVFGPAQRLHGATFAATIEVEREELSDNQIVLDIGTLKTEVRAVLSDLDYRNLDEHPAFAGRLSTAELVARHIHRELGRRLPVGGGMTLTVTLEESPSAFARYRAPVKSSATVPPPRP